MDPPEFDAIVVGSGISGGWAAKELTERGLRVLVLERGHDLQHGRDYLYEHAGPWQLPFHGMPDRVRNARDYPVQSTSYAFGEATRRYWNNDRLNPYVRDATKPFNWMRADVVGGRSLMWARQTYRWSDLDFRANAREGQAIPWPVSYRDIAPWYSHVEKFIGVSGEAEGLAHLPDGEFLPPMPYHALERIIQHRVHAKLPDVRLTMGRCAVLTREHNGRAPCHYCGPCERGCSTGSYFSSQSSTLPAARATGRLTLLPGQVVERLVHDDTGRRVTAVRAIDAQSGERREYSARLVFLCASALASTQILLNSASERHPQGLANGSGALGRYLMDHGELMHTGIFIDAPHSYYRGNRPNNLYIPRFRNLDGRDTDADFARGYGMQAVTIRPDWQTAFNRRGFGAAYKESLRRPGAFWIWAAAAFLECLPRADNRAFLHSRERDRFGIPQLAIEFAWGENELRMADDVKVQIERIMRAAGAMAWEAVGPGTLAPGGSAIHEMGTARMGEDPAQSVLNAFNRAHEVDNLYVTDGAFMTSSACVNPSLTYMAFTARACEHAVQQLSSEAVDGRTAPA